MKRSWIRWLAVLGCVSLFSGVGLLTMGHYTVQAQDEPAEYVGSDECSSCHRNLARSHSESNHALALQEVGRRQDNILGDFDQGEAVRTILLPGEDTARPFTADDIAYVIGAGQHVQRYLYEVDRNEYLVLPAEWNVETQTWEPYQRAETWPADAYDWEQNCAYCHTTGLDVERERWEEDGVQCEACHGPGSIHAELADNAGRNPNDEELLAVRSAIYTAPDPQVCGQCHSQGVGADDHPFPVGYVPGMDLSEVYQLVPTNSADHWWVTGHASQPNMQYNEWLNSTHATSLTDMQESEFAGDECLTCHSEDARQTAARIAAVDEGDREGQPPEPMSVANAQWGVTCTTCHYPHTDSEQPFELVQEANSLCTSCHTNPVEESFIHHPVKEMFEGVTLVEGIEGAAGAHFTAENGPACMTCHMQSIPVEMGTTSRVSHLFRPVLPGQSDELPSACAGCHEDLTATDMQLLVEDTQASVQSRLSAAEESLKSISEPAADSEAMSRYQQVTDALNFVQNDGSLGIHNYTYADALLSAAENNLALLSGTVATVEPTIAPLSTVAPNVEDSQTTTTPETVSSGIRPITLLVIGTVIAILLISAFAFFRKSGGQET